MAKFPNLNTTKSLKICKTSIFADLCWRWWQWRDEEADDEDSGSVGSIGAGGHDRS